MPLRRVSADAFEVFERDRPERLIFQYDAQKNLTGLSLGGVFFARNVESAPGQVFKITPLQPVEQLRREAMASRPPVEAGTLLEAGSG